MAVFYWGSVIGMITCGGLFLYGIVVLIKNWKTAELGARTKSIIGSAGVISVGIVCFIVFSIVGLFYEPFANETSKDTVISQKLIYEDFLLKYQESAAKFKIEQTDAWVIEKGEKADVAKQSGNNWAIVASLSKISPVYVDGLVHTYSASDVQTETLEALFISYALILACDTSITTETVAEVYSGLLNNMNKEMVSKSGVEYSMSEVSGNIALFITMPLD